MVSVVLSLRAWRCGVVVFSWFRVIHGSWEPLTWLKSPVAQCLQLLGDSLGVGSLTAIRQSSHIPTQPRSYPALLKQTSIDVGLDEGPHPTFKEGFMLLNSEDSNLVGY
jgi:hypothetical protein